MEELLKKVLEGNLRFEVYGLKKTTSFVYFAITIINNVNVRE